MNISAWMVRPLTELNELWQWWYSQLESLSWNFLQWIAPRWSQRGAVIFVDDQVHFWKLSGQLARPCGSPCVASDVDLAAQMEANPQLRELRGSRVTIGLAETDVLRLILTLPRAAERDLARIIELQLERELPLSLDRSAVHSRIVERSRERGEIRVEVLAAHRDRVMEVRNRVAGWGFVPSTIGVAASGADVVGDLLPAKRRRRSARTRQERRLTQSAIALSGLFMLVLGGQWVYERVQITNTLTTQRANNAETREALVKLRARQEQAGQLLKQLEEPDASEILSQLTPQIPSDAWVYDLDIDVGDADGAAIRFSGFAPRAAELARALEESPAFADVIVVNSVPDGAANRERVQLAMRRQTGSGT